MATEVRLPELGEGITSAKLVAWVKHEGDAVSAGEAIAEIETDKTTLEIEAPCNGTLTAIHVSAGNDSVEIGAVIAEIAESSTVTSASAEPSPSATRRSRSPEPVVRDAVKQAVDASQQHSTTINVTPLAARIARLTDLDLSGISTNEKRVTKADVDRALGRTRLSTTRSGPVTAPPDSAIGASDPNAPPFTDQPLSVARRVTAARLQQSKQTVPHFYLQADCHVDRLVGLRGELNASARGRKLTVTDFIVCAVARALAKVPLANSAWVERAVRIYNEVDIAVAVNTPVGLLTPVVRQCNKKSLYEISHELAELAERARKGQLKRDEYVGGTFTVSNLGMFGVTSITPIVNPPQSCILGVGAIEARAVIVDGALTVGHCMSCTLAADHRSIDGAIGAQLLAEIRHRLENPLAMVIDMSQASIEG